MNQTCQLLRQLAMTQNVSIHNQLSPESYFSLANSRFHDPPFEWFYFITNVSNGLGDYRGHTFFIYPIILEQPEILEFVYSEELSNFEAEIGKTEFDDKNEYLVTTAEKYLLLNITYTTKHYLEFTGPTKGKSSLYLYFIQ
jgi:hypothetical protein